MSKFIIIDEVKRNALRDKYLADEIEGGSAGYALALAELISNGKIVDLSVDAAKTRSHAFDPYLMRHLGINNMEVAYAAGYIQSVKDILK